MVESAIEPISANYQIESIETSFNWNKILSQHRGTNFYLFEFRAVLLPNADMVDIIAKDDAAYAVAKKLEILEYFKGEPNGNGEIMSWCLWRFLSSAKAAANSDEHKAAMAIAEANYRPFNVYAHLLTKTFEGIRFAKLTDRPSHP